MHLKKIRNSLVFTDFCGSSDDLLKSFHIGKKQRYRYLQKGCIQLNDTVLFQHRAVSNNDKISIALLPEEDLIQPCYQKLDIVYEDDVLLVINKPLHMLVHGDGSSNDVCVHQLVKAHYLSSGYPYPVRCIHRLDKDTTGTLIYCKFSFFLPLLDHMLQTNAIKRTYAVLATGIFNQNMFQIQKPIGSDRHQNNRYIVHPKGSMATTDFIVKKRFVDYTYLTCTLQNGRTHQIRVHLASINHPILGDPLYGSTSPLIERLALHAYMVEMIHPLTKKRLCISCKIPDVMERLMQ